MAWKPGGNSSFSLFSRYFTTKLFYGSYRNHVRCWVVTKRTYETNFSLKPGKRRFNQNQQDRKPCWSSVNNMWTKWHHCQWLMMLEPVERRPSQNNLEISPGPLSLRYLYTCSCLLPPSASFDFLLCMEPAPHFLPVLTLSIPPSFLCPAQHIADVVRTADMVSLPLHLPHTFASFPLLSWGCVDVLHVWTGEQSLTHWVWVCMHACMCVCDRGAGPCRRWVDDSISLCVNPTLNSRGKATQFICQIHINVL